MNKIYWRCYIRLSEWRGDTRDFSFLFRLIKTGGLWQITCRGQQNTDPAPGSGYTTLSAAKKAAQKMANDAEQWRASRET